MDCMQACEILSAAHDGELVDAALLAEARRHAMTCAECAAFVRMLDRIAATLPPRAPERLVSRVDELAAAAAAAGLREAQEPESVPVPDFADLHEHPAPVEWLPRFTAFAAAAAVVLVVMVIGSIALIGQTGQKATESSADRTLGETQLVAPTAEGTAPAGAADTGTVATQPSPSYVSLDSAVWILTGAAAPDPSTLTTIGVVASALDGREQADHPAYNVGADRSTLYVKTSDGRYLSFKRVVRALGRSPYGLMTGTPIAAFGTWPTLPERFAQPQTTDGAPTFRRAGFDDTNLDVYIPADGSLTDGFAVAPGTAAGDPAAGNPNWTWWERIR